ncbi:hypothetical protein O3P69_000407 [Scylla paramamosain]|uniref:RNA-directed DNA polymerase n=1 Tax=Scylla paramamosain TaxID=85552 RepID=A0AAW0UT06_SCYPA
MQALPVITWARKRSLCRLRQRFYWVGMRSDMTEWCRACDVCSAKGPTRKNRVPLQVYSVGAPMEQVVVDIAGPLPLTPRGNRYICVVMVYFAKWPEAYALPNHEAETVAGVLVNEFFTRFGVPAELHSDQGREFESQVFRKCCELLAVCKTRTTPLHPQSDGMVERFNRTLAQQLAKYCEEDQGGWDVKLPAMLMANRSAVHEAADFTPACLMFGRELRLPVDLATERPPHVSLPTVTSGYVAALQEYLVEVHRRARGKLKVAGQAMKETYDRRMRNVSKRAADLQAISQKTKPSKTDAILGENKREFLSFIPVVLPVRYETVTLTSIKYTSTIKHPSVTATVQISNCIPPAVPFEAEECPSSDPATDPTTYPTTDLTTDPITDPTTTAL